MALLGSSLQGQLSGFQFLVHLDQDKNQGTPHTLENQGCLGDRPKETLGRDPRVDPWSFLRSPPRAAVFSFSVFRCP